MKLLVHKNGKKTCELCLKTAPLIGCIFGIVCCCDHSCMIPRMCSKQSCFPLNIMYYLSIKQKYITNRPFAWSSHMVQNHTCWWATCTVGLSKQSNLYQSTLACLCFGSPTVQLAHQHVWFCTMWPDHAKAYIMLILLIPLQDWYLKI